MNGQKPALLNYSLVPYGYNRIFSLPSGGATRIKDDVEKFNQRAVLQFCAKLSLLLFAKGVSSFEFQTGACKIVFSDEFRNRLIKLIRREPKNYGPFVIFHEQSILYLAKEALLSASLGKGFKVNQDNVQSLGILLLIASDVCLGWTERSNLILPPGIEAERVRESYAKFSFFQLADNFRDQYARFFLIFQEARNIAKERDMDLEEIFTEATGGVDLPSFLTLTFTLLVNWILGRSKEPDINKEWIFCKRKYFKDTKLDRKQIDKILNFLSLDIKDFKRIHEANIQEVLSGKDVPEYNFLAFQQKPLIRYKGECFICVSPRYFTERATEGIYWIMEHFLKVKNHSNWKRLPDIWGKAYENYTNSILSSIFGNKYISNLKDDQGRERADGILIGKRILGLVQIKYAHWRYGTKITGYKKAMAEDLERLIKGGKYPKGLGQHARDITAYLKGEWSISSQELIAAGSILPILVVGETMPMDAFNRYFYETLAKQAGLDFHSQLVLPFIILDAEDVELVERYTLTFGGDAVEDLLIEYSKLFEIKDANVYTRNSINFKNFVLSKGKLLNPNSRLLKVFDLLVDKAREDAFGVKTLRV